MRQVMVVILLSIIAIELGIIVMKLPIPSVTGQSAMRAIIVGIDIQPGVGWPNRGALPVLIRYEPWMCGGTTTSECAHSDDGSVKVRNTR